MANGTEVNPTSIENGPQEGSIDGYLNSIQDDGLFDPSQQVTEGALFAPITPPAQIGLSLATNRAHQDSIINRDAAGMPQRVSEHLEGNVQDETVARMQGLLEEQSVLDLGALDPENLARLSPNERIDLIIGQMNRIDLNDNSVRPRDIALMEFFRAGGGDRTVSEFEAGYKQVDISDLVARANFRTQQGREEARREIDDIAAANSWNSYGEMFIEVGLQDFVPIVGLATRIGLDRKILETVTGKPVNGWQGFFLGEIRQKIREELLSQSPEEFKQTTAAVKQMVLALQKDDFYAPLLTKYNLIESLEAIFTDENFDGTSAKNSGDRFFGNFETVLEGIFSVVTIAKIGGTVRGAYRGMNKVKASQLATASGSPEVAGRLADEFQTDSLAVAFGLEADEAVPALLPRPVTFVDDINELPEGSKDVIIRTQAVRSEIMETTGDARLALTRTDRTNVVNQEISALDLADGAAVQPRMSTLQKFDDDSGFRMRVVVGESAEGGYKNIEDAMLEAIDIDPDLVKVNISRIGPNGTLEPVFDSAEDFQSALFRKQVDSTTAGRILGGDTTDESFYLTYDVDRFYHSADKEAFTGSTFLSGGVLPRAILSPNAKFGDEIYGNFLKAYMDEEALARNFDILFEPYYKLGREDKRFVASAFEWMEDFGKNNGRAPTLNETLVKYDGLTEGQTNGLIAIREGMDTMHDLFNRRLYRNFQGQGFKTARPADNTLPTYHGAALEREVATPGFALDPVTQKMVRLSRKQMDELYDDGGSIMKLDMAVDAANDAGNKATRIITRKGDYEVGDLSTTPLIYHPGYSIRFYDDPYYIVKKTDGIKVDGSARSGASSQTTEAIRTAGTQRSAAAFAARANRASERRGWGSQFEVVRGNDISKTESTLFQKQSIHREGRMFWDERNFDRLPDVNGNRAQLEDPVKALERGIGLASRQLTHEDLLKSVKGAWVNEYGHLFQNAQDLELIKAMDLGAISQRLKTMRQNAVGKEAKASIVRGKELIDYFRLIEGTDSAITPLIREAAIGIAQTLERILTPRAARALEKGAQTVDPLRSMRSAAFYAFMVFRPARQALLQATQISLLAPLAPKYVASLQIFKDARMLSRGISQLRKAGFVDDGISVAKAAKTMGLTQKEYRLLIKQFNRSGLVDLVDVHSFAGGSAKFRKTQLGEDTILGAVGYRTRQTSRATTGFLQKHGFDFGEKYNVMLTYNLALKRVMERNGFKSLTELSPKQWDNLRVESSNLSLGMARPNNFGYQTGTFSLATQFLSFSHKSALALMGANPAIKGADALKIVLGSYALYGANMYGAKDQVEDILTGMGVADADVPGMKGATLVNLLSAGLIDTTFNALGQATIDDWKDLDLGPFAPGFDVERMWGQTLTDLVQQPSKAIFGPFGNIFSSTMESFDYAHNLVVADSDIAPADKFAKASAMILSGAFPQFNDAFKVYLGYQMNRWYSNSLEPLPLRPTMNTLLARGLMGVRSKEELSYYRLQNAIWEDESAYRATVKDVQGFLTKQITLFSQGTLTREQFLSNSRTIMNLFEEWPEGRKIQLRKDIMILQREDSALPTMERQIVELYRNKRLDQRELLPLIDRFVDIPEEKREELKLILKEAWASKINAENVAAEEGK